jgi:hypothetical protein
MDSHKPSDFGVVWHLIQSIRPHIRFIRSSDFFKVLMSRCALFCSSVQVFAVSLTSVQESLPTTLRLANASDRYSAHKRLSLSGCPFR